jgi:hypothetical protein
MAISRHRTRAVLERYNIVSGRDLKEAGAAMERAQKPKMRAQPAARAKMEEMMEMTDSKWCPGRDLNPHSPSGEKDFKSFASAGFATRAYL